MHKLVLGILILLAALAVACGGDDEESPAATDAPEDEATATESAGGDAGGGTITSSELPISITVTVPDGWEQPADADGPELFAVVEPGVGYIDFLQPTQFYTYASETESELGGPPADYVKWFTENPFLTLVGTEEATVGGLSGTRLEITNDYEAFALFKFPDGTNYDLSYLDHIHAYVLDADGTQIIVSCGVPGSSDFEAFAETCDDVLATAEFGT